MFVPITTGWASGFIVPSLAPSPYVPHVNFDVWQAGLVWLHAMSDGTMAAAYFTISAALIYFVQRRQDVPFRGLFWLFGAFIAACGLTHALAILTLWFPLHWVSGSVKAITAVISLFTALKLVPRIPAALAMPNTKLLTRLNQSLFQGIAERKQAEAIYQQLNADLEARVERRTAELTQAQQRNEHLLQQEQAVRSELQIALAQQRDTTERLKIALGAAQMGTWDWHLADHILLWSPRTWSILGLSPDEAGASYDRWRDSVHPDDVSRVEDAIAIARGNQDIFSEEYRIQWPDRSWHWVLAQGRFIYADGQPHRMIGVVQETTKAKQATLALAASESRFRAVFEQAAVGVARLSPEGKWLQVNATLCDLLGYSPEELIHQPFQAFTDPADLAQDEHYYQQLMAGDVSACRFEKRYLHKNSTPIWTKVTVSTETDAQNKVLSFIAVIEDIRQLKQTTDELKQRAHELEQVNSLLAVSNAIVKSRNAELDQFAYVASHDLKAPLRAIANLSEWLEEDLGNNLPDENRQQLDLLRNRVHRMEGLINGLLEYSRVGRRERRTEIVDVHQLLTETIDLISPPETFTITIPEHLPCLETNRSVLNQVFSNLISNAIKHHDRDDGQIEITATEREKFVEFAVKDDGPGIAPQYQQKVFAIFQTLKARDEFESTGIGLAIVKKTVQSEGGTLTLESAVGQWSTFQFTWPRS